MTLEPTTAELISSRNQPGNPPKPDRATEETVMHSTPLLRRARARACARAILLPLLAASTVLATAATAQGTPIQAPARGRPLAPAASRPPLAWQHHIGAAFSPQPWRSGPAPNAGPFTGSSGFGSALVGSAPVQPGPSAVAVNRATHTIYVANGYNTDGPNAGGNTVSVIDARHCNAQDVSRCKGPWPTITVGNLPAGVTVDQQTDTVYVTDAGDNAVSVFNGATCNALDTSGCGQKPATVPVGAAPLALFDDPANHTVYIANCGSACGAGGPSSTAVSMLDTSTCNAADLAGCPATQPPTVDVGAAPVNVDVDQASHTVYVTTIGALNGWAVFDASTCNATTQAGCGTIGRLTGDPSGPNDAAVDPANDTLYTANFDNTISAFDLRHCWAGDLAGCVSQKPGTVTPLPNVGFDHDLWVAVDVPLHSVYVSFQKDDSLIVVDTSACNGSHRAACAALQPPMIHTGADPEGIVLDSQTQTLYTANEVDNDISVIDASQCNAQTTAGCRHPAPAMAIAAGAGAADPAVHTAYITSGSNTVSMIDTTSCNASHLSGCAATPPTVTVGNGPNAVAVDRQTHTVYVANFGNGSSGTVSVINAATCNATSTAGCATPATLQVPGGKPDDLTVNAATGTLYVATLTTSGPNLISVFNTATCNATHTAGCGQAPAVLKVGDSAGGNSALSLAVNQVTNTIYAANLVFANPFVGNTVSVINGATCDAANTIGCGQTPATVKVGDNPFAIAVDPATDTIYTANFADGEHPGTVSVIKGATCNGTNHTGCGQTPATAAAVFGSGAVAIDPTTDTVYVTNLEDTSVTVINGATCNGTDTTGCGQAHPKAAVGNYPGPITVDPAVGTVYVSNGDNTLSVIHG
jgi:DNA-binding beta-propeller fold protein YncE